MYLLEDCKQSRFKVKSKLNLDLSKLNLDLGESLSTFDPLVGRS